MSNLVINFYGSPGGAERRFARAVNYLLTKDENVTLLINSIALEKLSSIGVKTNDKNVIEIKDYLYFSHIAAFSKFFFIVQLWWIIANKKIKHIHYPVDPSYLTFFHSFIGKIFDVTYSISVVDSMHANKTDFNLFTWFIWRRSLAASIRIDCLSYGIKDNIKKLFVELPDIEVSPCSFTDYSNSSVSYVKDYDVVFMGRFVQGKGIDLFLDALELLSGSENVISIDKVGIFGSGPLGDYIVSRTQRIAGLNIEVGFTENPFEIFSRTKVFVSLQEKENYPSQSLLEAIACGVFVIATDVGESYRIVSSERGFLVVANPENLACALIQALEKIRAGDFNAFAESESIRKEHNIERFSEYLLAFFSNAKNAIK